MEGLGKKKVKNSVNHHIIARDTFPVKSAQLMTSVESNTGKDVTGRAYRGQQTSRKASTRYLHPSWMLRVSENGFLVIQRFQ
jgi:hypothetical protein